MPIPYFFDIIGKNLVKPTLKYMGTQGTSGIKIYNKCIASTGLTEGVAKATTNYNIGSITIDENHRPEFMPAFENVKVKYVYKQENHKK